MKRVRYSPLQKVQTLVASIVLGCPHTKAINHELVPDRVAAQEWGMERFPDQSQINLFLNRMTEENVGQLGQVNHELLLAHSQLRSEPVVVVDLDQTGLTVTGKHFELASKGYLPRRRGSRGYQFSTALASADGRESEAVAGTWTPATRPRASASTISRGPLWRRSSSGARRSGSGSTPATAITQRWRP